MAIMVFMAIVGTVSAQKDPAGQLVGTWQFDDISSFATMDEASRAHLDSLPQLKAQVLGSYSGRKLSISPNGNCTLSLASGQSASFGWVLSNDGVLTLKDASGNMAHETVRVLTDERLVLVPVVQRDMKNIIGEQHYIKQ